MKVKWRPRFANPDYTGEGDIPTGRLTMEEILIRSKRMHPKKGTYKRRIWTEEEVKFSRYRL